MPHAFLSDSWLTEARAIRQRYAADVQPVTMSLRVNIVVNDAPFGDEPIASYIDTSSGTVTMELGQLDSADVTLTTDYETAKALFLENDPAAGMQAFMAGKIVVQGDMMKLVVLPALAAGDPVAQQANAEIQAITE